MSRRTAKQIFAAVCLSVILLLLKTGPLFAQNEVANDEPFDAGLRYFEQRDYRNAWDTLLPLAQNGNARAAYYLGAMRDPGFHSIGDQHYEMKYLKFDAAIHWYRIAANDDDPYALYGLSQAYQLNIPDMPMNKAKLAKNYGGRAYKHLKPLSEQGDAIATYMIADIRKGKSNYQYWSDKAGKTLTRCALEGNAWCQLYLGRYYLFSMSNDANNDRDLYPKSFAWLSIATENGNAHGDALRVFAIALMTEDQYPLADRLVTEYKQQISSPLASQ